MSGTALRGSVNWKILPAVSASTFSLIWGREWASPGTLCPGSPGRAGCGCPGCWGQTLPLGLLFQYETLQRKGSVSPPFNVAQSFLSTSCFSEHSMWLVENLLNRNPSLFYGWISEKSVVSACFSVPSSLPSFSTFWRGHVKKLAFNF